MLPVGFIYYIFIYSCFFSTTWRPVDGRTVWALVYRMVFSQCKWKPFFFNCSKSREIFFSERGIRTHKSKVLKLTHRYAQCNDHQHWWVSGYDLLIHSLHMIPKRSPFISDLQKKIWEEGESNIHKASYKLSLIATPLSTCAITTPCSWVGPTYPSYGYLMIVFGNKNHGMRREGKETNEDEKGNEAAWIPTHPQEEAQTDSQLHLLLILLEDGANVLEDIRVEQVDATVDDVAHKRARLFHIMENLRWKDESIWFHIQAELSGQSSDRKRYEPRVSAHFQQYSHNSWTAFCLPESRRTDVCFDQQALWMWRYEDKFVKQLTVVPRMTKLLASPCSCWKLSISARGNAEHTSALRTKNACGLPETIWSLKW